MEIKMLFSPYGEHFGALCELWREAFGDGEDFASRFVSMKCHYGVCAAFDGGELLGAVHLVKLSDKVLYGYAVATFLRHRGRGVCAALHEHIKTLGTGYIVHPATGSLCGFYAKMGLEPLAYTYYIPIEGDGGTVSEISAREYVQMRDFYFDGYRHPAEWLEVGGYTLIGFDVSGVWCAAAISGDVICEVIAPGDLQGAAARRAASAAGQGRLRCFSDSPLCADIAVMGFGVCDYRYFNLFME